MTGTLAGLRVGVTRSRTQASVLAERLADAGAVPVELACLEFVPPNSWQAFDAAWAERAGFDGIIFTSVNAVQRALERGGPVGETRVVASGPATAEALRERGVSDVLVPDRYLSEGVLEALDQAFGDLAGTRWLIPRAEEARQVLPKGLRARGADVVVAPVYRAVPPRDPGPLRRALAGGLDVVTFASGATARYFVQAVADLSVLDGVAVASIGPVTTKACRELGLQVAIEAERATIPALVEAIEAWRSAA